MEELLKYKKIEDLQYIQSLPTNALIQVCKIALDTIKNGTNQSKIQDFISSFGGSIEQNETTVDIIVMIIVNCIRNAPKNFQFLVDAGFSEDHIEVLKQFINSKYEFISALLKNESNNEWKYRGLEWRVEGSVASRASQASQAAPIISLKFHLDSESNPEKQSMLNTTEKQVTLQLEPNDLREIIKNIESALDEQKSYRSKNFLNHDFE